ncbi:hypothetical protein DL546_001212 [Coniochaeta pulveracea]|uniref:ATP-dependent RNA helicase DHX8 n=1 Tax=Coniochaeta pulveracea TaxID=177199 RepID=A0A420YHY5_9PEZI|nr:hypothetical protein DL546_001212 [Coniochaeta pulveracea]
MAPPHRQIRAQYDDETITVYQAYNSTIASAAVAQQQLDASPHFRTTRMTWIKPSWAWMLYRCGYSYKDPGQERVLALKMRHADFLRLLERGVLSHAPDPGSRNGGVTTAVSNLPEARTSGQERQKPTTVRIQWDPERTVRLEKLDYRSIQIGIPGSHMAEFIAAIVGIEDVTDKARKLKRILDESPGVTDQELLDMGLVPVERLFELPDDLQKTLGMV